MKPYSLIPGLIAILFLLSPSTYAGTEEDWAVKNVYVVSAEHYYKGGSIVRVIYEARENSIIPDESFGCAVNTTPISGTTDRYHASYWLSNPNIRHQTFLSMFLSAQAQGLPVDLMFDPSGCDTNQSRGLGGMGRRMHGVRIVAD